MTLPTPAVYSPDLTADRLQTVANWLLDELQATEDDLVRATDTRWTKGCTTFGRQHSRVVAEWQSRMHPWLGMLDTSKALVFTIGEVPCRFSNDDPDNPSKKAVLEINPYQRAFAEFFSAELLLRGRPGHEWSGGPLCRPSRPYRRQPSCLSVGVRCGAGVPR
jgi:hypothetical protein